MLRKVLCVWPGAIVGPANKSGNASAAICPTTTVRNYRRECGEILWSLCRTAPSPGAASAAGAAATVTSTPRRMRTRPAAINRAIARRTERECQITLRVWFGAAVSPSNKNGGIGCHWCGTGSPLWADSTAGIVRLPRISPGACGGEPEKLFAFGTMRLPGSPTPQEAAAVPSDTPLCSVAVRDLECEETPYKIKRHAKMEEIFTDHANRRSTTPDSLCGFFAMDNVFTRIRCSAR